MEFRTKLDDSNKTDSIDKTHRLKLFTEYGPLVVFFVSYWLADLYVATGAIVVATIVVLAVSYVVEKKIPMLPLFTGGIILVFGGLTLWLKDETFIKMKPTIIQLAFGVVLLAGLKFNLIFLQKLLGKAINLQEHGWKLLTIRISIFFFFLAGLNELVWRTQSTDFWVNFKVFGITGLTIVFLVFQMQSLKRYLILDGNSSN